MLCRFYKPFTQFKAVFRAVSESVAVNRGTYRDILRYVPPAIKCNSFYSMHYVIFMDLMRFLEQTTMLRTLTHFYM